VTSEKSFFKERRTIGVWGWELDVFPEQWFESLELVDEVWVWTSYVAETLSRRSPKPVVIIPPPVVVPDFGDVKPKLGIPEGFTFLFVFDFHSVMQRKNPTGLVEAFKRAFAPGEGPQLVLKSINGDARPGFLERLKVAALDRTDSELRLLCIAASERGLWPYSGGGDGSWEAGDRNGILRKHRLHERRE
jgi:hypothetical protein